ncbi:sensor histidine kinase [Prauserella marina]|uniref:sensor histidine kinase n=1 Tax=Prauserella marina TaxID=530584 RepID=UPI000B8A5160|nr:histidine kinase [Prauserella marina]
MNGWIRRVVGPVADRRTYRRWTYLILGGALLAPYLLFAAFVVPATVPITTEVGPALALGGAVTLLVLAGTSLLPAVRVLERAAVRELLDDPVADAGLTGGREWADLVRGGIMFVTHVLVGGALSLASLLLPVFLVFSFAAPFTGRLAIGFSVGPDAPRGWAGAWIPALFLLVTVLFFHVVNWAGAVLSTLASRLLGPSVAERIAALERRTGQLAERNRLARELHDSVGHTLSVVSIQAGAARRTLHTDPETAERALLAIEDSARSALDDLDYVLGLLRDETATRTPAKGLAQLSSLAEASRAGGMPFEEDVRGDLTSVAPTVDREAYRILQECLTNVLRHAGRVAVAVVVEVGDDELTLTVRNPLGATRGKRRNGGGSGLRGIADRVAVLGGELDFGGRGEFWEVSVRLPKGGGTS